MAFAIKTEITAPDANAFVFQAVKTMYGGKRVAAGDTVFVFASENAGGCGLIAKGIVVSAEALPNRPGPARQTPRVNLSLRRSARAERPLGRGELKGFDRWEDGRPETELNFKFYRQATNKLVGISAETEAFLDRFF